MRLRDCMIMCLSIIVLAFVLLFLKGNSLAEEVFTFVVLPQETPAPVKAPEPDVIPRYDIPEEDIRTIAKLLWSSPLRSEYQKEKLVWVVLNRVDDNSGLFGDTVKEVVTKKEFSFYDRHAHVSDTNKDIVARVMGEWIAEKNGLRIGSRPPRIAVYIRFNGDDNREIELTGTPGGEALSW